MRAEEARLSENNQGMEKVKQQHFIQEEKVCFSKATMFPITLYNSMCYKL